MSHICYGEFGGIVSFFDKKKEIYYDGRSTCAVTVNKLNNNFYVTSFLGHMMSQSDIIRVADPREFHKRDTNPESEWHKYLRKLNSGAEIILDSAGLTIHSSFLYENNLYHIYSDDSTCAIGKIKDGALTEQVSLDFFPSLQHRLDSNDQFLTFSTKSRFQPEETFEFGIMEIVDGELRLHYIANLE